jgi:hypothetical protein
VPSNVSVDVAAVNALIAADRAEVNQLRVALHSADPTTGQLAATDRLYIHRSGHNQEHVRQDLSPTNTSGEVKTWRVHE